MSNAFADVSYWFDTLAEHVVPRSALPGSDAVDVAIVGGGYTGLWAAYYLLSADPSLRVTVIESEVAGFGASGRNGGWCSALYPVSLKAMAARHGYGAALAQQQAMFDNLDAIEAVLHAENIECDWARGGTIDVARTRSQLQRAQASVGEARAFGFGPGRLDLLDAAAARRHVEASSMLGATFTPDCAVVQPAKLVRALARTVERRGGRIVEGTRARSVEPGVVRTDRGDLRADHVLLCTEGFTPVLPGFRRDVVPVYSLMIVTAPLPDDIWDAIGLGDRPTFTDHRHLIVYGQRTADHRIAFGGRGAPYHFGSAVRPEFDREPGVFEALQHALIDLFPILDGVEITHRWGGPLGVTRDWSPSVHYDPVTGFGRAGGYVGDGVSTTHLAGRTLADLVLRHDTELTRLPWVGHRSPEWEPEPLRWIGARALSRLVAAEDTAEARGRTLGPLAGTVDRFLRG